MEKRKLGEEASSGLGSATCVENLSQGSERSLIKAAQRLFKNEAAKRLHQNFEIDCNGIF